MTNEQNVPKTTQIDGMEKAPDILQFITTNQTNSRYSCLQQLNGIKLI